VGDRRLERLYRRFQLRDDVAALGRVFDLAAPELLRVARHLCGDEAAAEDALQETFLAAIEKRAQYDPARRFMPWMLGILANRAREARRRSGRVPDPSCHDALASSREADPAERAAQDELRRAIDEGVAALPPTYAAAVRAYLADGRTPSEVAHMLGISGNAANVRIHRGLKLLRKSLPAALALPALSAPAPGGLASVRARVLARAAAHSGRALPCGTGLLTAPVLIGGALMTKASLAALLFGAVLLATWLAWPARGPTPLPPAVAAAPEPSAPSPGVEAQVRTSTSRRDALAAVAQGRTAEPEDEQAPLRPQSFSFAGQVVDHAGAPVAGASVRRMAREGEVVLCESAGDGSFVFESERDQLEIWARSADHAPSAEREVRADHDPDTGAQQRVTLVLPCAGVHLRGVVVDEDDRPLEGASVEIGRRTDALRPDGSKASGAPPIVLVSDAVGAFEARGLPPGTWPIAARLQERGFAPYEGGTYTASAGESIEVRIVLSPGCTIGGVVTGPDGEDLPDVRVSAKRPRDSIAHAGTRTDSTGRFELRGIHPGLFEVTAATRGDFEPATREFLLQHGQSGLWNPRLQRGSRISGRVVDHEGAPLVGWHVLIVPPDNPHVWSDKARTAEDGSFVLADPPSGGFHVAVRTPDLWDGGSIVERDDVRAGDTDVTIRVPREAVPSAVITGRVLYADGRVVPGAKVAYARQDGSRMSFRAQSDPVDGRFRIGPLRPDRYALSVHGEGQGAPLDLGPRDLAPERKLDLGDVVLERPGALVPRLVLPEDEQRGSFRYRLAYGEGEHRIGFLDARGEIPARILLAPGSYSIAIEGSHYFWEEAEFDVAPNQDTPLELTLRLATIRALSFQARGGTPAPDEVSAVLRAARSGEVLESARIAPDGQGALVWRLDLEPADYVIEAETADGRRGRVVFSSRPNRRDQSETVMVLLQ